MRIYGVYAEENGFNGLGVKNKRERTTKAKEIDWNKVWLI